MLDVGYERIAFSYPPTKKTVCRTLKLEIRISFFFFCMPHHRGSTVCCCCVFATLLLGKQKDDIRGANIVKVTAGGILWCCPDTLIDTLSKSTLSKPVSATLCAMSIQQQ